MNTPTPLIPGGLEQKNKGRARIKIAVFFVLAVHVVVLGALLMQGCKRQQEQPQSTESVPILENTNPTPPSLDTNPIPPYGITSLPTNPPPDLTHAEVVTPAAGTVEYSVVKGDSFYTLSKKFHVTMKAIQDANPGVDSRKLKLGQKLNIPAPTAATSTLHSPAAGAHEESADNIYSVKSGDTLTKIAADHGVTLKALRAANNLTTDRIKVGQKLKLPPKATPGTETVPTTTSPSPIPPASR